MIDVERDPACWAWPLPDEPAPDTADHHTLDFYIYEWQQYRCGICSYGLDDLVMDHHHPTVLARGYLCRGCNTKEGHARGVTDVYARWRACPVVALLGVRITYSAPHLNPPPPDPAHRGGPVYLPAWAPLSTVWPNGASA